MSPVGLHATICDKIHLHISMEISLFADKVTNSFLTKWNQAVQSKQGLKKKKKRKKSVAGTSIWKRRQPPMHQVLNKTLIK